MKSKNCIAMILAGGQGSRLASLTKNIAKPAVSYGGRYRIIDFTLSNCTHSGLDTVGILTQYRPLELNTYIGNGQPWDLDRNMGGAYILPPYMKSDSGEWYRGTANAIYQNIDFIEQFSPKYILILSGDHIYKMHYGKMIKYHEKQGGEATIAVIRVPLSEASRFGIMNTDSENRITEFEEKPKNPKSNFASMGIYVFNWQTLKKYLIIDENNKNSSNDFGKNIIPAMLRNGEQMYAYPFEGYWRDVGTVESLWQANMDLIGNPSQFDLHDKDWRIFSRTSVRPPHFIGKSALVTKSIVTEGCEIYGDSDMSVISEGVLIEKGAQIKHSVIMSDVKICSGTKIENAIIGNNTVIGKNCIIGGKEKVTLLGGGIRIADNVHISAGESVENDILSQNISEHKLKEAE